MSHTRRHSEYPVHVGLIFPDPTIRESRERGIIVTEMPYIKRSGSSRTHFTSSTVWLLTIVSPCLLISEDFIIMRISGSIDFFVEYWLSANVGEHRKVIVKAIFARE